MRRAEDRIDAGRRRIYEILEIGHGEDVVSQWVDRFLIGLILLNVVAFTAETVPEIEAAYGGWLRAFELFSVAVFTVEYALRIWSCVETPFLRRLSLWRARLRFAIRPYPLIDLMAILPFYLGALLPVDLRILRLVRVLRFLKIARYSPALLALIQVLVNERRALVGALLLMAMMLLFAATGMYMIERHAQPEAFGTIPDAAWWAMATLTTVGYGDVAPVTGLGKVFGGLVMILGLGMFALPIAIIATGFAQELRRRDFVVTWPLMARIPHLADLDAGDVAHLTPHFRALDFPPHWDVVSPGDAANSIYFIASGALRRRGRDAEATPEAAAVLSVGDVFGEQAILDGAPHDAALTTVSRVRLLELQQRDFHRLENSSPHVARHLRRVAEAVADKSVAAKSASDATAGAQLDRRISE